MKAKDIGIALIATNPFYEEYDEDGEPEGGNVLSVNEAAMIWASHGKDEDYMCGYTDNTSYKNVYEFKRQV